jgi:HNH endonuclease/AP2 domain
MLYGFLFHKEESKVDYEDLNKELTYNPETGQFFWKKEAGTITGHGYRYIRVNGKMMLAHRMAWLMAYGEDPEGKLIDHINGNRLDNRIENLRLATYSQNSANAKRHSRNTSGLKGASKVVRKGKWTGRWQSSITVDNKQVHLGSFGTKEQAHAAYMVAARKAQGEFASDGKPPD